MVAAPLKPYRVAEPKDKSYRYDVQDPPAGFE